MKSEKKFFIVNDRRYAIVSGKIRWYVEYYDLYRNTIKNRKRVYGGINREKNPDKRKELAIQLIYSIAYDDNHTNSLSPLHQILLSYKASYRKKTWQSLKTKLKYYRIWLNGKQELRITTENANEFLHHLLSIGKHPTTVRGYKMALSSLYNKIDKNNNPFSGTFSIPKQTTSMMYFNDQQIIKIKNYLMEEDTELWTAIQLLFYCFIRPGEMRGLRKYDVNLQDRFIEIRAEISKNKKTQKVSIPDAFISFLTNYLNGIEDEGGLILSKGHGGQYMIGLNYLNRKHSKVLKTLKIAGRYSFYSWKHTGVVKAVKHGINIKDLQLQLRHHSLDMVNEYLKNLGVLDSTDLRNKFPAI